MIVYSTLQALNQKAKQSVGISNCWLTSNTKMHAAVRNNNSIDIFAIELGKIEIRIRYYQNQNWEMLPKSNFKIETTHVISSITETNSLARLLALRLKNHCSWVR